MLIHAQPATCKEKEDEGAAVPEAGGDYDLPKEWVDITEIVY